MLRSAAALYASMCLFGCAAVPPSRATPEPPRQADATSSRALPDYDLLVGAGDRDEADRALDAGRKPTALLAFAQVRRGMRVAELGAGGGYTTELLARSVGDTGVVFGQNTQFILERFADKPWAARLAKPVNATVVSVTRPFDDPLPPEAGELDVVLCVLFYHDTFWMNVDHAKMNAAVLRALKPGGWFIVVDHAARDGAGATEVKSLHRIEESIVTDEITRAGFRLAETSDFLRNTADTKDWNAAPGSAGERRGESDRFALRFVRP